MKQIKKLSTLIMAVSVIGSALLCSCNTNTAVETTTVTTIEETTTTTTEATEATTTAPRWETEAPEENPKDTTPYEKITLDGKKESTFVSTDFCYIESEKYVLLLDRDIKLPGDFVTNVDAIINEIEKELGVSACPSDLDYSTVTDLSVYYDKTDEDGSIINPWEDWDIGAKIPIFLVTDREDKARISCASNNFTVICDYALFSDELWNSIPSYKNNGWRRNKYVDYTSIAHELTHTITLRHCDQTNILSEGIAQYMGKKIVYDLAKDYPSINACKKGYNWEESNIPQKVSAKNAEKIFIDDYHSLSHAQRGAEYYFGHHFWQYLFENYGDDAFVKYNNMMHMKKIEYNYSDYNEDTVKAIADIFKELYGDDVFSKFGKWCVKKNYLQNKNY